MGRPLSHVHARSVTHLKRAELEETGVAPKFMENYENSKQKNNPLLPQTPSSRTAVRLIMRDAPVDDVALELPGWNAFSEHDVEVGERAILGLWQTEPRPDGQEDDKGCGNESRLCTLAHVH